MDAATMQRRGETRGGGSGGWAARLAVAAAAVGQLVVLVPFTIASGLLAPLWAVIAFHLLWLAAAAALVVTARRRPLLAPLVPVTNGALLWLLLTLGDLALGWTA